ncbi:flagellin [Pararhodobacter aggregans]|uniref:Flagellin C-terminal domain-containing protein n=1 Tax=Pararhodobacter aggregans TaxID=404875 RepID=A0A2T7UTR3_9RHOB|nr:flagellin [Pararhodobacter aggregans]PTX02730.1 flagellar hook-associated protein 3 FlgL [Pararhodobacter aggregans]PVE47961.1 hypothetical protein DDE23_07395 [Pararhodobacter aggregans]
MSWLTLGSLALPFTMNRNALILRQEMSRLNQEVVTGVAKDPQRRLRGDLGPLSAVESRLSRIEAFTQANTLATNAADIAQSALNRAGDIASDIGNRMLAVSIDGIAPATLRAGATAARNALGDLASTLSQRVAGRAVLSGNASDTAPLPDGEAILATILPSVTGLTDPDDIVTAVTAAFMDPGGLFETTLYQGGPAAEGPAIDTAANAPALPTAADPALRKLMAGLVISALAGSTALGLADVHRQQMAQAGAEALIGAAPAIAEAQASLGETQARLDTTLTRLGGERDALTLARHSLIGVDPYQAASELDVVQTRLETLYALTARTQRLSLTEYL